MSEAELQALLCEWQESLRLRDWDVKLFVRRQRDMSTATCQAECMNSVKLKEATIHLVDPVDYKPSWPVDQEVDVVHELIHLHFAPFWRDDAEVPMEQAIEALAKAFVALKRRSR